MVKMAQAVSVVIPVHNEEMAIEATIDAVRWHLESAGVEHEVIVVDDGSTDSSAELLCRRSDCRVVRHATNRGYGAALKTGIAQARHGLIAILDADGTYPVERLPDLVNRANEADMVVGSRQSGFFTEFWLRRFAKWVLTWFAALLTGRRIPDLNSGMRVFSKSLAERYRPLFPDGFSFTTTITVAMLTDGRRVVFEPVRYMRRLGRSKIRPIADTLNVARSIVRTTFYFAPGRIIAPLATAGSLLLGACLTWNALHVPETVDRMLLMLANIVQLGLILFLCEITQRRATRTETE